MFTFLTEIHAENPKKPGEFNIYWGPRISAISERLAYEKLQSMELYYCKIVGYMVGEVNANDTTFGADWSTYRDHEYIWN